MSYAGIIRESLSGLTGKELTVFLHILVNCNHSENPNFKFNNKVIPLKRGEWVTSIPKLKGLTNYSDQQIRTSLKNLTNLTYCLTDNLTNRGRKITVVNIDDFLFSGDRSTDQLTDQLTDQQQTANRPLTINKKDNNNNNKKNDIKDYPPNPPREIFDLPEGINKNTWRDYEEMRNKIRKPMTPKAKKLAVSKLIKINQETNHDPNEVLEQSIMNSWQGLFPVKNNGALKNDRFSNNNTKTDASTQALQVLAKLDKRHGGSDSFEDY